MPLQMKKLITPVKDGPILDRTGADGTQLDPCVIVQASISRDAKYLPKSALPGEALHGAYPTCLQLPLQVL